MKRFLLFMLTLFAVALPVTAQAQRTTGLAQDVTFIWEPLWMRNTAAASLVASDANWAKGGHGSPSAAFVDSLYFRRGGTSLLAYDTSSAYRTEEFPFPPNVGNVASNTVESDSTNVPWIILKVRADSTASTYTTGLDSVRVAAEYSNDGAQWFSCSGTPTYRFDTVFLTSGQDGLQSPTLIGVERSPGEDAATVVLKAHFGQANGTAIIVNRSLWSAGAYVRFIIGMDGSGQFKTEVGHWHQN